MKVYMGPYISRWMSKIHTNYMNKKYGYFDWSDNTTKTEHFLEWLEDRLQKVYNFTINKYFDKKERKIKVRIDDYDVWGADHTIAVIVHPLLIRLKEKKHGTPLVDDEDLPEEFKTRKFDSNDDEMLARWDWIMDEMIWAMEQCSEPDHGESQFYSGHVDFKFEKDEESGFSEMKRGPNHTFKVDRVGMIEHYARMKNGHRLFGKYFLALWD